MPVVNYDYDYYEYQNGKKVNKASNTKRVSAKEDPSVFSTRKTRQSTKEQVRLATYESPKKNISRKKKEELEIPFMQPKKNKNSSIKTITKSRRDNMKKNVTSKEKKEKQKPIEMKLKKPELSQAQKKKAREKVLRRIKNGFYLAFGFMIAFFICYRYSLIDEKFNELEKTKKELSTAQTVNEQIQADIDSQTDLSYIENYAKYQLGMQKPSSSQIVYVNVEKEDRILTPVTIEEDSSKTWLEQLYEEIAKLFE